MKRVIMVPILAINALLWIILSLINYVGIMRQFHEDVIRIFIWSTFTITIYVILIYSITLVITRIFYFYLYNDYKAKYVDRRAVAKQVIYLTGTVVYVYGVCYYDSNFLGLIPALIFFSKMLTDLGRFYVYREDQLILIENFNKEYVVLDCSQKGRKIDLQIMNAKNLNVSEKNCFMSPGEIKFLSGFFMKETGEKEVA